MTKREQIEARRLQTTIMRGHWGRFDRENAAKRAIPQTAEEVEASRNYLRAAFGLGRGENQIHNPLGGESEENP